MVVACWVVMQFSDSAVGDSSNGMVVEWDWWQCSAMVLRYDGRMLDGNAVQWVVVQWGGSTVGGNKSKAV